MKSVDVQAAFRAGIGGRSYSESDATLRYGLAEAASGFALGGNEQLGLELGRLPGLSEPRSAFATGRAVRRILALFDQARAPASVGRQFLDNLRAAVISQHARPGDGSWGAADTVAMFMEMYGRVHGTTGDDFRIVETRLLEDALGGDGSGGGLGAALRRLRRRG